MAFKGHQPWNKGISTKELGKARPKIKWKKFICLICKTEKEDWSISKRKFCSRKCHNKWMKQHPNVCSPFQKLKIGQKISKAKKGKPLLAIKGNKHWHWISDRTKLKGYGVESEDRRSFMNKEWSSRVKKRDNWTCKINNHDCSEKIESHHILSYSVYPAL